MKVSARLHKKFGLKSLKVPSPLPLPAKTQTPLLVQIPVLLNLGLKEHSGQKFFAWYSQKSLTDLKLEVESSRTFLASRTHFEVLGLILEGQVLGLGLEASSPQKLPCPRLEDSTVFCTVEILLENARNLAENLRRRFLQLEID